MYSTYNGVDLFVLFMIPSLDYLCHLFGLHMLLIVMLRCILQTLLIIL